MWVFDGEKWIDEGISPQTAEERRPLDPRDFEEFYPELQVVELPRTEKREYIPIPILIP